MTHVNMVVCVCVCVCMIKKCVVFMFMVCRFSRQQPFSSSAHCDMELLLMWSVESEGWVKEGSKVTLV